MNFGDLVDATNAAGRDMAVIVLVGGKEYRIVDVQLHPIDLDEGKKLGDTAEGYGRPDTVWVHCE
jgi:hypothetical protein